MKGTIFMQKKTLILNNREVASLLSLDDTIAAVESAYKSFSSGNTNIPPITSIDIPEHNGEMDFKSGYSREEDLISMKIASGFWDNPKKFDLPSCVALVCLLDADNGVPLCIMDGALITGIRTGAAGAAAARVMARKDSRKAAIIGTGGQARMQIRALARVLPIESVNIWGIEGCNAYRQDMSALLPNITFTVFNSIQDAVHGCDIVITATPSREPLIMADWVEPGMHLTAVGCDAPGKQEWDPAVFLRVGKVVNDSIEECVRRGETQHPIRLGYLKKEDIYAEIGEILLGRKPGRTSDDEITLYDTTGLSILDLNTAAMVYRAAIEKKIGTFIDII